MNTEREVLRCSHCGLTQFLTEVEKCRRCGTLLRKPEPPPTWGINTQGKVIDLQAPRKRETSAEGDAASNVGRNLRAIREVKGVTQQQLSERLGMPRSWLSRIECGTNVPTLRSLQRIAAALRVSIVALVDANYQPAEIEHELRTDPFLAECAALVGELTAEDRQHLLLNLRTMAARLTVASSHKPEAVA